MPDFKDDARTAANRASTATVQATNIASQAGQVAQGAEAAGGGDLGGAASALSSLLSGGTPLEEVRFDFSSSAAPGVPWHVYRVQVNEGLSELYEATVDLTLERLAIDTDALVGSSCELQLQRGSLTRRVLGIAHRIEYLGSLAEKLQVRVHIVPALWAMSQRIDSYIFQDKSVPEILEEVLKEGLQPFKREVTLSLQRTYPVREYCVQYAESDLEFVQRLMREEGIAFYFEHEGEAEKLVLVDSTPQAQPSQTLDGSAVRLSAEAGTLYEVETVKSLEWATHLCPTGAVVRDFDWTRPQFDVTSETQGKNEAGREQYVYPAELTIGGYSEGDRRYTKEDGSARAHLFREAQESGRQRGRGLSNVTGFTPGQSFTLQGHERSELNRDYLITHVEHAGEAPDEKLPVAPGESSKERYSNRFECIPLSVPFRPEAPAPRRRVPGLQTATVVGRQGEEIHTDVHGRIKVQFHWDREGQRDEHASCWVRVAQAWAGVGFGALFIPRLGMEVVVDFLEGNPDRPLVIGCVYNGTHPPPLNLPDERTRSTVRTESSPGGGGYNELRFEDAAGSEEIFIHAQKDMNETVENNHTVTIGGDEVISITGNQLISVTGNHSVSIQGKGKSPVHSTTNITGKHQMDASDTIEIQAPTHVKLTCGGSFILIEPSKITLFAGAGAQVVLDANALTQSSQGSKVLLDANALTQSSIGAKTLHDANVLSQAVPGASLLLDANATVNAPANASVNAGAAATLAAGAAATVQGGASATVTAPQVTLSGAKVSVPGGLITSDAGGINNISAAIVKIN